MNIRPMFFEDLLKQIGITKPETPYIRGSDMLPLPLNPEEEAHYIVLLANGDTNARNVLIERNLRFVVHISRNFENTGIDIEDLISIGTIGLVKAVQTFKVNMNTKFATYTSRCIKNEILMHLRKTKKHKLEVSFDEPISGDTNEDELILSNLLSSEDDLTDSFFENEYERELLMHIVRDLPKKERDLIILRFGLDGSERKTQKEVASLLNISQPYISNLEKQIISKLKHEMCKHM